MIVYFCLLSYNFKKDDTGLNKQFTKIKIMYYTGLQGDICLVMTSTWSKENNFL